MKSREEEMRDIQPRKLIVVIVLSVAIVQSGAETEDGFSGSESLACNRTSLGRPIPRPVIWEGKLQYYGESKEETSLVSTAGLLDFYTDEELKWVVELYISSARLLHIEHLNRLPNLRKLDLGGNRIASLDGLNACPLLEVINLSQNWLERIEGLESLPHLRELYLGHNRIKRIEGLETLKGLEVLMLEGNQISKIEGLGELPTLKRLGLAGNKLRDVSGLLELGDLNDVSIRSLDNKLDNASLEIIAEWNRRHSDNPFAQL
jgi:Leucine-rich repeat (LRR) protein